jgi:hypothetical protein
MFLTESNGMTFPEILHQLIDIHPQLRQVLNTITTSPQLPTIFCFDRPSPHRFLSDSILQRSTIIDDFNQHQ